ncbi:MAG: adenylate/guanylate cyclase domain-containing protein [Armatimonadetes bacterium]|nr:adenylate/guanylate cyclase domain-containing protein [Armatimonadota bacterium]
MSQRHLLKEYPPESKYKLRRTMPLPRISTQLAIAAGIGILVAVAGQTMPGLGFLVAEAEMRSLDWRFSLRGPRPPGADIALVAVDDASLARVGRWPWPRARLAQLVEHIQAAGAKAVVLDILLSEPSAPQDDARLEETLRRYDNVFMPAFVAGTSAQGIGHLPTIERWRSVVTVGEEQRAAQLLYSPPGLAVPLKRFSRWCRDVGVVSLIGSTDGVYRETALVCVADGLLVPSLPLAVATHVLAGSPKAVRVVPGHYVEVAGRRIPLDINGLSLINFAGPRGTYRHVPAADVLTGEQDALRQLAGKIVLVGVTAAGLHDLRPSPFDPVFVGSEALATVTANVLQGDFLRPLAEYYHLTIGALLSIAVGVAAVVFPTAWGWAAPLLLIGVYWAASVVAFSQLGLVMPLVLPTAAGGSALAASLAMRLGAEERRRERAVAVFSRFVPPRVARRLVGSDMEAAERGERRETTALFVDIEGSTGYALRLDPENLVDALNAFFTECHLAVWRYDGTLDKFIGDGLLAFFNAPVLQEDHALRAVRTALDIAEMVERNRDLWEYHGLSNLRVRAGICTGEVVVGYVGSKERMQYTVIGPAVHLAARLQELAKDLGVTVLISESTYAKVAADVEARGLGERLVRGFDMPVRVYEVIRARGGAG